MSNHTLRPVVHVVTAHRQHEGAGFIVRRPFPTTGLSSADPFLMLDEMGPVDYAPGEALGASAVIETRTPIAYHDWTLRPGASIDVPLPESFAAYVYVFGGAARVGDRDLADGQLAVLGEGGAVHLEVRADATEPA